MVDDLNTCYAEKCSRGTSGLKRKHSTLEYERNAQFLTTSKLKDLVDEIRQGLAAQCADETIHLCGRAPLAIISSRPRDVLRLAHQQLNAKPYADVQTRWRRLHEEASLYQIIAILHGGEASASSVENDATRAHPMDGREIASQECYATLDLVIAILDRTIMISGCPGRRPLFNDIFLRLRALLPDDEMHRENMPERYHICEPGQLPSAHQIPRYDTAPGLEAFHFQLRKAQPCVMPEILEHWPALRLWQDPRYLLQATLGGRRLVPVEIGSSYTEEGWAQRIIPMREFIETYVLPDKPSAIGYLAQYDLFEHLPELKYDIITPDYCYTSPPAPDEDTLKTAGFSTAKHIDEPLRNAWFGPKGTKTPLHTDPYHNILCQVVGYKYVRMYGPAETARLYPCGVDENGISMENTSAIDIALVRPDLIGLHSDAHARIEQDDTFPLFKDAQYVETVLSPGESLYIPVGWWHYVESLSTSFSVSFWWN